MSKKGGQHQEPHHPAHKKPSVAVRAFSAFGFIVVLHPIIQTCVFLALSRFIFPSWSQWGTPSVHFVTSELTRITGLTITDAQLPILAVVLSYLSLWLTVIPVNVYALVDPRFKVSIANPRQARAHYSAFGSRLLSAHENITENFPGFAIAVLFAIVTKVPSDVLLTCCFVFTVARAIYYFSYVLGWGFPRSLAWMTSFQIVLMLFLVSALPVLTSHLGFPGHAAKSAPIKA